MARIKPFEDHSAAYDQWFDRHPDLYHAELKAIQGLFPQGEHRIDVEVGVGSGKFAAPLGIRFGVDPSLKMLERAKRQGIEVCMGVAEALPLHSQSFRLVLMVTTICFVDDIDLSFREAKRVLIQGGSLIVGFVDKKSPLGRIYEAQKGESRFYSLATFYSTEEVLHHLTSTGFQIDRIRQTIIDGMSPDVVLDGYGKGSFIVIKARRP